jgi:hypothetical protein
MRQANIPDVDLLETMYLNSSVRLQDQGRDGVTINSRDHQALQRWFDLVDWEAESVQRSNAKIQEGIHAPPERELAEKPTPEGRNRMVVNYHDRDED